MKRTTLTLTVLSEDSIPEEMEVSRVLHECMEGDYVLASVATTDEELTPEQMADALTDAGSDPSFFQLDTL
jgi:hypothetical protein